MNDRWFNIGMILILTSLVANGFIIMLTEIPGGNQFNSLQKSDLTYGAIKQDYSEHVNSQASISTTATNYDGSGLTPIVDEDNNPFGIDPLRLLIVAVVGLETLLFALAQIFSIFAIIFYAVIAVMLAVKLVIVAYFASMLIRAIFGQRT